MRGNPGIMIQSTLILGFVLGAVALIDPSRLMMVSALAGGMILTYLIFQIQESKLPLLLLLTLALGSAYRWDIAQKSFYIRFFVLGLLAIRGAYILFHRPVGRGKFKDPFEWTILHSCFLLVVIFGLMSTFYSVQPMLSFQRAFSFFLLFFVVAVFFWRRIRSLESIQELSVSLWKSVAIILVLGFSFLLLGVPGMFHGGRLRLIIGNPNQLGHYCALLSPIVIWYLFQGKDRLRWLIAILMVAALIGSGSRGALLATFVGLGIQFALCYRQKLLWGLIVLGLVLPLQIFISKSDVMMENEPSFFEENILRGEELESGSGRTGIWKLALHVIDKRPFFGHGFATVDHLFRSGYLPQLGSFQGGHIHNSYLEELVNLGWVGASPIFFSILYLYFKFFGFLLRMKAMGKEIFQLGVAFFCMIIMGTISGVVESWFTSVGSVFCFPFWLAGMLAMRLSQISMQKTNNQAEEKQVCVAL